MSEEKENIIWNGNNGRTIEGKEFRKSDDGQVYEHKNGAFEPASAKPDSVVDLSAIKWEGEMGRTVDGRHFRKSGNNLYERIKEEWIPVSKPEVDVKEAVAKAELEPMPLKEPPQEKYAKGYKVPAELKITESFKAKEPKMGMMKQMTKRLPDGTYVPVGEEEEVQTTKPTPEEEKEMRKEATLAFLDRLFNKRGNK